MINLVPAKKQLLQMKRSKRMIKPCQPLRHAQIVSILGLKRKLLKEVVELFETVNWSQAEPAISPYVSQSRVSLTYQAKDEENIQTFGRCLIGESDQIVVQVGCADRQL